VNSVNARDLHSFLEVGKDFSNWIKAQVERARLVEHRDFEKVAQKGELSATGQTRIDYFLTFDAAKHIGMMTGTDKGFEVRDYFIECERRALNPVDPIQALNDPATMRSLLLTYSEKVLTLEHQVGELHPKADGFDRIATADGSICLTNAAKVLQIPPKQFMGSLNQREWIYRRVGSSGWLAYQNRIQQGYLEHKVTTVSRSDGSEKIVEQVLVTPKGLARLSVLLDSSRMRPLAGMEEMQ
jgi:phage anti-repressor protein/phage antirepressor YoqD-like protein